MPKALGWTFSTEEGAGTLGAHTVHYICLRLRTSYVLINRSLSSFLLSRTSVLKCLPLTFPFARMD